MNQGAAEWIDKAEGDFRVMERESRVRKMPNYDAVCFHAQQSAEKYLKARLTALKIVFPHTHFLPVLLDLLVQREPPWEAFRVDLAYLSNYAAEVRYPGSATTREFAIEARAKCRRFRIAARRAFGLDS